MIEFKNRIVKLKAFKNLDNQHKSDKFIALYSKIFEYIDSIPKEKVIQKLIYKNFCFRVNTIFGYIYHFLEAKDFYHWKNRIYSLLIEKYSMSDYQRYVLLYNSKASYYYNIRISNQCNKVKETYNSKSKEEKENMILKQKISYHSKSKEEKELIQKKKENSCLKNNGVKHPLQSSKIQDKRNITIKNKSKEEKELVKEKVSNTWKNKSKEEIKNIVHKRKDSCMNTLGVDNPMRSKEIVNKVKETRNNKSEEEKKNSIKKGIKTKLELYGSIYGPNKCCGDHSKSGDEICLAIDNALGNPEDSKYATKNGEFFLRNNNYNIRKYDYCIPSMMLIVEVDDPYWHALDNNPDDIIKYPGGKLVLAKEIHKRDKEKEELAIQNGYKVYHIRDDEYKKDPKSTIEKLINIINNDIKIRI